MLFDKPTPLTVYVCPRCKGATTNGLWKCSECQGLAMGHISRGQFLYFGEPFTRYHITLRKSQRILHFFEVFGALFCGIAFFILFVWQLTNNHIQFDIFDLQFWTTTGLQYEFFLWLSFGSFSFLMYRVLNFGTGVQTVETKKFSEKPVVEQAPLLENIQNFGQLLSQFKKRKDISLTFDLESLFALEDAFQLAVKNKEATITLAHVFAALLKKNKIRMLFLRLAVQPKVIEAKLAQLFVSQNFVGDPQFHNDVMEVIFAAYDAAYERREDKVYITDLLEQTILYAPALQEMLYDMSLEKEKLKNVIEWMRIRERLYRRYQQMRRAAQSRNKYGLDRAMTAVATPYLNSFSQDLTYAASVGNLNPCVGRDKEFDEIFRVVEAGRQSVILVGETNVGKMSLIEGICQLMVEDNVPDRLKDKRFEVLSTSALLAGTAVSGAQERLMRLLREALQAKNIILYIHNIHDLINPGGGFDVSETLAEYLSSGRLLLFASTTPDNYNQKILRSSLGSVMTKVEIAEMEDNQAVQVLESRVGGVEYKHNIFFSYDALATAVKLARKFLRDQLLPESAIELMNESASLARNKKGENTMVTKEDVAEIVQQKTGIPVTALSDDESSRLLKLEDEMHKRMIGQTEAVSLVANALRRARAEIRSTKKPISSFLFLGPTGVGKTELAKTIAEVYFGGENRMVRFDMSEYQDRSGIYRMIGAPGQQGTGLLTEAVRQRPFSLVLLDEMEKADKQILDLFLQVFDDGRLTDSVGRVIDFTNTIIIATSNAGTPYVQAELQKGTSMSDIQEGLLRRELKSYFRPEFINRFDGVVVFKPLDKEATAQIARLMLRRVAKDLEAKGVSFRVDPSGIDLLCEVGFDPEFGARPMRRAIQDLVENRLAEFILQGKLQRRDVVVLDQTGLRVEKAT